MPSDVELLRVALDRFRLVDSTETHQRKREAEDLAFAAGEQWDKEVEAARKGMDGVGILPPVPARPCLTINKLLQPLDQVGNAQRQARLALKLAPKGNGANQETAEIFGDIARAIQVDSRAHLARSWAFDRAVRCGRGFYRILVDYANDGDDKLDILYRRILNQANVFYDPYAEEPDWSDARFCFIVQDLPLERFRQDYPDTKIAVADDDTLSGIGAEFPGWFVTDGGDENRTVRIAEYFYIEYEETSRDLGKPDYEGKPAVRKIRTPKVKWCKITALDILEKNVWPGRYIPVIPVIAREENVNGDRRWVGMVRPARDANRSYNYMRSAQVEAVGLAPRAPFLVDPEQIEGYEAFWNQYNTRSFPYLPRRSYDQRGSPYLPAERQVAEPAIQAITLAAHEADGDVKATTGIFDPSLGNLSPQERSGKAILALQKQAETGTSGFIDNLAHMSMMLEGKILIDLIPKVYEPGRVVAAVGEDEQRRNVVLGAPYAETKDGPQAVPPEAQGQPGVKAPIDLEKGQYQIVPVIGKSTTTRREEGAAAMGELASAVPQLVSAYADLWVGNLDFPGSRQIADRLKKLLPPQLQDDQQHDPEMQLMKAQQQLQQQGQLLEMMTKELDAKTKIIETDQVKAESAFKLEKTKQDAEILQAQLDGETKIKIAEIQSQTSFGVAEIKAMLDSYKLRLAHIESLVGHQAEMESLAVEGGQEAALQQSDQAFQAQEAQAGRDQEMALTGSQQAHEQEMAEQQAAQKPAE